MEPWRARGSHTHRASLLSISILPTPNFSWSSQLLLLASFFLPLLSFPSLFSPSPFHISNLNLLPPTPSNPSLLSALHLVGLSTNPILHPPMRIRKRQAPLPLPSFPPVPLSDPRPIQPSPMVQLTHASSPESSAPLIQQQPEASTALTAFLLDHPRPLPPMAKPEDAGDSSDIVAESGAHDHHAKLDRSDEAGGERDGGGEKRNDTGKGLFLGSGTLSEALPLSPSNLDGKWCDGEKAIPPKKRRGRRGDYMMNTTRESNSNTNNNKKMKTKMNKKCTQNDDERNGEEEEEEERKEEVIVDVNTTSKKRGRGSAVMEGSRCSRVNGRGWRCCQQTLVGYSLCEHHLGKGRLRSITSVRSRYIPSTTKNNDSLSLDDDSSCGASSSSPQKKSKYDSSADVDEEHKDEKKPPGVITKKRMKLGMVKARSISSLLGQTNTIVSLHENNK